MGPPQRAIEPDIRLKVHEVQREQTSAEHNGYRAGERGAHYAQRITRTPAGDQYRGEETVEHAGGDLHARGRLHDTNAAQCRPHRY
jgi:hypothetical protein